MKFTQTTSQTSINGLVATIVPNAATGSQLVLQQATTVFTVDIAEIVNDINAQLIAAKEKKELEETKQPCEAELVTPKEEKKTKKSKKDVGAIVDKI